MPRTLEACRSLAFVSPPASWEISGPGSRDRAGATMPIASSAGSPRAERMSAPIACIRSAGSAMPTGPASQARDDAVAAGGVARAPDGDRDRDRHLLDRLPELLVVAAERAEQRREERVVERAAGRLRRGAQVGELDVERAEAPGHAAAAQQRRSFRAAVAEHAPQRARRSAARRRALGPGRARTRSRARRAVRDRARAAPARRARADGRAPGQACGCSGTGGSGCGLSGFDSRVRECRLDSRSTMPRPSLVAWCSLSM